MSSSEAIEAEAADWLARMDQMDRQDGAEETLCGFEAWCRADPRNLAAYLRLLEVWNQLNALECAAPAASQPLRERQSLGLRLVSS